MIPAATPEGLPVTALAHDPDRPVPFALTPLALAALAAGPGPRFCPESMAADRPHYCDPDDCCRDLAARRGGGRWACARCGDAWFGAPPDSGLCPGCASTPVPR
jgi:hypothetical protein